MGNSTSRDKAADFELTSQRKNKVLLLGAADSGKTTISLLLKNLCGELILDMEMSEQYLPIIHSNIIKNLKLLVSQAASKVDVLNAPPIDNFMSWRDDKVLGPADKLVLEQIWSDPGVDYIWTNRDTWELTGSDIKLQLQDTLGYFMDNLDRLCAKEKKELCIQDLLNCYHPTTGIIENRLSGDSFNMSNSALSFFDVGGSRNERRKWIHCFDNVHVVIFVVDISGYDQHIYEDVNQNKQDESLDMFKKLVNQELFRDTPFVVFFNKVDIFRRKLGTVPFRLDNRVTRRNIEYGGPVYKYDSNEDIIYSSALEYMKRKYWLAALPHHYKLYVFETNSLDPNNFKHIMSAFRDFLI